MVRVRRHGLLRAPEGRGGGGSGRVSQSGNKREPMLERPEIERLAGALGAFERVAFKDLKSDNPMTRAIGVKSLRAAKGAEPILEEMLKDRGIFSVSSQESQMFRIPMRGMVGEEALWELVARNSKKSANAIRGMLRDPEPSVRESAREALMLLTNDLRYHRLYQKVVDDPSFFRTKGEKIPKREFEKTGSRLILLGGKYAGKQIVRILPAKSYAAWKKALESTEAWKKAGFDYVPVEPIVGRRSGKPKVFRRKNGEIGVYSEVLGISLGDYVIRRAMENGELINLRESKAYGDMLRGELSGGFADSNALERFGNPDGVLDQAHKIINVIESMGIRHGHEHPWNFCIKTHNGKPRVYFIDFDRAEITK